MEDWLPDDYLRFADERNRPARDLIARISLKAPELVYDLGCGPGNSTALLREAYPQAKLVGLDTSKTMLAKARKGLPQVQFMEADIAAWPGEPDADLLYANASFQWVPDHVSVLLRLPKGLKTGSVLALQMPDNLNEPSHRLMRETAETGPWAKALKDAAGSREPDLATLVRIAETLDTTPNHLLGIEPEAASIADERGKLRQQLAADARTLDARALRLTIGLVRTVIEHHGGRTKRA